MVCFSIVIWYNLGIYKLLVVNIREDNLVYQEQRYRSKKKKNMKWIYSVGYLYEYGGGKVVKLVIK